MVLAGVVRGFAKGRLVDMVGAVRSAAFVRGSAFFHTKSAPFKIFPSTRLRATAHASNEVPRTYEERSR